MSSVCLSFSHPPHYLLHTLGGPGGPVYVLDVAHSLCCPLPVLLFELDDEDDVPNGLISPLALVGNGMLISPLALIGNGMSPLAEIGRGIVGGSEDVLLLFCCVDEGVCCGGGGGGGAAEDELVC